MAKHMDTCLDAALNALKGSAIRASFCSADPVNYAGIAAVELAEATISGTDWTGPTDNSPTGRKITFNGKASITPSANGTVTHIAFHDNSSVLYAVTEATSQAVTTSQSWDIPSGVPVSIADPT